MLRSSNCSLETPDKFSGVLKIVSPKRNKEIVSSVFYSVQIVHTTGIGICLRNDYMRMTINHYILSDKKTYFLLGMFMGTNLVVI